MQPGGERQHPDRHRRQRPGFGQPFKLAHHHGGATDRAVQDGLVEHNVEGGAGGDPGEQRLPSHPDADPPLDLRVVHAGVVRPDHGAGVVLGLQQSGHQFRLVPGEVRSRLLQADVDVEVFGDDVAVGVPPAACLGLLGQGHQRLGDVRRCPVDPAHGLHVEAAHPGLPGLDAPHLRLRPLQLRRRRPHRQPSLSAQVTQVPAELAPRHRRPGRALGHHAILLAMK